MRYNLAMPELTAPHVLDFCNSNYDFLSDYQELAFDYKYMSTFEPFGMLLASSKIRSIQRQYPHLNFFDSEFKQHDYAGHMGYFKSFGQDFGKDPGEAWGSNRYIPVTRLNIKDLRIESYQHTEEVQDTIVRKSNECAKVLSQGKQSLYEILSYSIRELMRNIVEHSDSDVIWLAAQAWPSKDLVEIAILDEGVGIKQAIDVNPNLDLDDHSDALMVAIEPGISGKAFKHNGKMRRQQGSKWDNSGYGLYVTSEICQLGGNFIMCSGDSALVMKNNDFRFLNTNFNGTAIRMRMEISSIDRFGSSLIDKIVSKGEKKARENSDVSVVRASKVSRLL
ncbi:ATP-binding protein [Pontibacillus chungwhensis]|uniref:ATP-binding protein n=1 Tax=Pontibacillus chungwhensis TaxID=265426 RepID=UPI000AF9483E|nr:ATP-binding protein [Pontibacillus chungwhensis]